MALFAACMQARERVVKTLTDYLESRPVKMTSTTSSYKPSVKTVQRTWKRCCMDKDEIL